MSIFTLLFLLLWYCIVGFAVVNFSAYPILLWRNLYYVLTDRRIIVRKGVIGIDYDILDLEYVQRVDLERGIWDRIYGTGTIVVQAVGVKTIEMYSIPDPFKSIDLLKKTVENVKSSKTPRI
ncbi:PH domain-containing protein [Candidatus Bathyarchaeota archaeon]|nr:PH domain-containing protein [Candidatus Bathyarchaeota archaeon]